MNSLLYTNPKVAIYKGHSNSLDILQQMVLCILNKAQVEKDEGTDAEALLRILIVVEGPK